MSLWYNNRYSTGQSVSNEYDRDKSGSNNSNFVQSLVGKDVKVNRGGPESLQGKLHSVKSDYLVLVTNEGVVYIANSHVKSVTEAGGKNKSGGNKSGNGNRSGGRNLGVVNANNFNGVIRALNQTFVQLNSGGPEKVEGFLAQAGNSSVLLVNGREVMQIQNFHIKSIKAAGNRSGGNNNNKNKSDNKNKTQGNRSGGRGNATRSSEK